MPKRTSTSNMIHTGNGRASASALGGKRAEGLHPSGRLSSDSARLKRKNPKCKGGDIGAALRQLKKSFKEHFYYSDDCSIDLVLGVVAGNHFDSDPCWLHLISPPSGGKTELLNSVFECDETYFLSDFTANALISGYKDPPRKSEDDEASDDEPHDYSLLPMLDGKVVVTKDFSLIHDKPSETRAQILAILRDVYDGYASRALGNSAVKGFHARFNYLTGMTPDIEKSWTLNTLGERFLMYRLQIADRREHARRSLRNANRTSAIRESLQEKVKAFIDSVPKNVVPALDRDMENRVLDLADLLATCRTYVHRDRNDEMLWLPLPELASRVAKQLLRVGQSVALVRGQSRITDAEFELMRRIALDSLPTNRRCLLLKLCRYGEQSQPLEVFQQDTKLSRTTVRRNLDDLHALGAVTRGKQKRKTKPFDVYRLSESFLDYCRNVGLYPPL